MSAEFRKTDRRLAILILSARHQQRRDQTVQALHGIIRSGVESREQVLIPILPSLTGRR